jgi:hypothetical protein
MHLHGHNFWVVAQGTGKWNGTITRPENPQRRDTQIIDAGNPYNGDPGGESYIVLDLVANNPGVWPFHCHVAWHVSDGLYINIMVSHFLAHVGDTEMIFTRSVLVIFPSAKSRPSWLKLAVTGLITAVTTSLTRSTPVSKPFVSDHKNFGLCFIISQHSAWKHVTTISRMLRASSFTLPRGERWR